MAQSTAVALDGADDSVRVPTRPPRSRRRRWRSRPGSGRPRCHGDATATLVRKDLQYLLRLGSGGAVSFRLWRGGAATEVTTPAGAVTAGAWSHVVASFDGTSLSIYVNGTVRLGAGAWERPWTPRRNPLYLGSSGGSDGSRGRLDEVAVYGTALPGRASARPLHQGEPGGRTPPPTVVARVAGARQHHGRPAGVLRHGGAARATRPR